ncbi:PP2C family protein-serine/threonine phosphatase [Streptomyces sp. AM 2-1-1]|uniref:PP2C family protein-serine/threonine phosphatase n=1 Tax=Streptomyces sp. AM 2-1-1 TaxID=3028709 RepID=UPI0023BA0796|nr:PP2C family protein-serine/threonine phosphatase [Streptomyces sp. AM 2-1-1]WEH42424.1 PP2C family protein-serine/threonine phosphatase [Streptomyces sp. AM 2-1-1]
MKDVTGSDSEHVLHALLAEVHTTAPTNLSVLVNRYAVRLGLGHAEIYLVDLQQRQLTLLSGEDRLPVDGSLAGWAYRAMSLRVQNTDARTLIVWLPLIDGEERLGVVGIHMETLDSTRLERCRTLASVLAMAITSKRAFSDRLVQQARTGTMTLPAEMLRALLPPRTIGDDRAVSTAVLEPAYALGGDAFDHALTESTLHAVILDAMGHNLASGLTTAIAMAGCRSARRRGSGLREMVRTIDEALAEWLPEQFCTGVAMQLDLASGILSWVNSGHPPPLLIRDDQVLENALEHPGEPPMGTPGTLGGHPRTVHEVSLRPGDRVILYTDGVTEARMPGGSQFGLDGFTTSIIRATAAGELASEALRQLIHALLDHQNDKLTDDATILMIEWRQPHRV